ncbi:S8 family peptidase [Brevundimonas sp. R86498]|uniref:S8 family peptidase n=1 Tax=Brevundimonas sp. R86498 TaxID=3093845 RepID=UPI0037C90215
MARYDHLRLVRLPEQLERRKTGGGQAPVRDAPVHGARIRSELDAVIETQKRRRRPDAINPSLILRVQMSGPLLEQEWEKVGLTVLSTDPDRTLVLFSTTDDLTEFRERLEAFSLGVPEGQKGPSFAAFIGGIETIGDVEPRDRIGLRLKEEGFNSPDDFLADDPYRLDIELWDLGRRDQRTRALEDITAYVEARGGEILDQYVGPSITMVRIEAIGALIRTLLTIEEIATIDRPPQPDLEVAELLQLTLADIPPFEPDGDDLPVIGVIDSGLNAHPLLDDIVVGSIGVPASLGTADDLGHGTRVAGVAIFGDLRAQLATPALTRVARLASARVVNQHGRFDDKRLVPSLMREAITTLNGRFGCRIFISSLADDKHVYRSAKVGAWAATLDELARELNVVIIVAAGNRLPRSGRRLDEGVTDYPHYLMEPENRLFEPAGALNILSVGSLAHGEGLDETLADDVKGRPVTLAGEPSPFTRAGPGAGGAVKPDVVDTGGTMIVDPLTGRMRGGDSLATAGVLTLHHRYVDQLFTTGSGTSYAAPLVGSKAAQVLRRFPTASANLMRALLVGSARQDAAALARMSPLGDDALKAVCGHGRVDTERAAFSDDARVVLYAEDELPVDHFAIYEVPCPEMFQTGGRRSIQVSLAYDPPVRHTRLDYAGNKMSFKLHRGCAPDLLFDHYRKRATEDGRHPDLEGRFTCKMEPGSNDRGRNSVQIGRVTFVRDSQDPDPFYLVVRCEGGWATDIAPRQAFAVVVEMALETEVRLYERMRTRVRVTA